MSFNVFQEEIKPGNYLCAHNKNIRRNSDTVLINSKQFLNSNEFTKDQLLLPLDIRTFSYSSSSSPTQSIKIAESESPNNELLQMADNNQNGEPIEFENKFKSRTSSISSLSPSKVLMQCFQNINSKIRKRHSVAVLKSNQLISTKLHSKNSKSTRNSSNMLNNAYNHLSYQSLNLANVPNLLVTQSTNKKKMLKQSNVQMKMKNKFQRSFESVKNRSKRSKSAPINQGKKKIPSKYSSNNIENTLENSTGKLLISCKYCDRKIEQTLTSNHNKDVKFDFSSR